MEVCCQLYTPAVLPPEKEPPDIQWTEGWVGRTVGLTRWWREKFPLSPPLGIEPQSSSWLNYPAPITLPNFQNAEYLTYLLTLWRRILFEKLIVPQLFKKYPAFLWNPKFHYRFHTNPPLNPILSQLNPACPIDLYLPKVHAEDQDIQNNNFASLLWNVKWDII
jgi:hypothetical protein